MKGAGAADGQAVATALSTTVFVGPAIGGLVRSGGFVEYPAAAGGESFFIQAQGSPGVALVSAATVHRNGSNDCHAQALGVLAG